MHGLGVLSPVPCMCMCWHAMHASMHQLLLLYVLVLLLVVAAAASAAKQPFIEHFICAD